MTFWDHIDQLRKALVQPLIAVVVLSVVAFIFKDAVFDVVLAANSPQFGTYAIADRISGNNHVVNGDTYVKLISTELPSQFLMHMKVSFCVGFLAALPFLIFRLFLYISPALYDNERKYSLRLVLSAVIAFFAGIVMNYYLIFPYSLRFLADYRVNEQVENTITLTSYISTMFTLSILMGLFFELPVVAWLLTKAGLIGPAYLRKYRRHAIVAIFIIAAVITPTTDVFTLLLVSVPILLLYEISILVSVFSSVKKKQEIPVTQ